MSRLLVEAGEALYGPRWQSEVARDLDLNIRTIQRMAAGVAEVRPGIYLDLLRLTQEHAAALTALADRLTRAATP